jgi:hypothetical protein
VVTEGHDALVLVVLPLHERLHGLLVVPRGVVGLVDEFGGVLHLESNAVFVRFKGVFSGAPFVPVLLLDFCRWQIELTEDPIATVPGLGIEHVEGEPLILHTNIHKSGVFEENTLVAVLNPQSILGLKSERLVKEGEMMLVTSAENDSIDILGGSILECAGLTFDFLEKGLG